jgi:hypothetical protein
VLPRIPLRGPDILKLCILVLTGRFPSCPSAWLASSHPGSLDRDYPKMKHETTWPGFVPRGIRPCLVLWRGTCPYWLSPMHGDPNSTQILTRHRGDQFQTVTQLKNAETMSTRQVPGQFSPSGLSKHLRMGSMHMPF